MENSSKCAYVSNYSVEGKPVDAVTFIRFIEALRGKSNSRFLKISAAKNEYDKQLFLSLEREDGRKIPYRIHGEALVRQFMADVVGYEIENPNPNSFMRSENMIDKSVEVFYSKGKITGISLVFPKQSKPRFSKISQDEIVKITLERLLKGPLSDNE